MRLVDFQNKNILVIWKKKLKKKNERETSDRNLMQTFLACIQVQDCKDGERSPVNQHSRHQDCSSSL